MFSRARVSGSLLLLLTSLALLLLTTACGTRSDSAAAKPASPTLWAEQPDAHGNYYAGNTQAKVVVEEWSDVQ